MNDNTQAPRSIMQILPELRRGGLVEEISQRLSELTLDVLGTGKAGVVTVTLKLRPSKLAHNAIDIEDDVKVKTPKPDTKSSMFFSDEEGALTRTDPNQEELPLNVVPMGQQKSAVASEVAAANAK